MTKIMYVLHLLFLCLIIAGCDNKGFQFNEVKLDNWYFSNEDTQILQKIISSAEIKKIYISDIPDVILYYKDSTGKDDFLSVYLKEGYIYNGYFIDAFTDEMKDKKSRVYYLSGSTLCEIKDIIDKYQNKQTGGTNTSG